MTGIILPALMLAIGLNLIWNIDILGATILLSTLQIIVYLFYKRMDNIKKIENTLNKYESLKYKKYLIPLICQNCGTTSNIELDLTNTEFTCPHCNTENAIYINFSTALKTNPLIDENDFLANVS